MKNRNRPGPQAEAEEFLTCITNIRAADEMEPAFRKYGQFLPPQLTSVTAKEIAEREVQWEQVFGPPLTPITLRKEKIMIVVGGLSAKLRKIWTERDPRRREWLIFKTRDYYHQLADPDHRHEVPALTPFELAMGHLVQNADRMGHCINPECPAPFFLAGDSHGRTYCSPVCAGPAKRLAKLRWWRKNRGKTRKRKGAGR